MRHRVWSRRQAVSRRDSFGRSFNAPRRRSTAWPVRIGPSSSAVASSLLNGTVRSSRCSIEMPAVRLSAVQLVIAQPSISSQLVDNLNASIHVRALLTDLFLIDEILEANERNRHSARSGRA